MSDMFGWLTAWFQNVIGRAAISVRFYSVAARQFGRALAIAPQRVDSRKGLAWTLSELGHFNAAVQEYRRVIEACPESAVAYHGLAFALQQLNRHREALDAFRTAFERAPHYACLHFNASTSYLACGQRSDAPAAARRAVHLDPGDPTFLANLGASLASLQYWDEAVGGLLTAARRGRNDNRSRSTSARACAQHLRPTSGHRCFANVNSFWNELLIRRSRLSGER